MSKFQCKTLVIFVVCVLSVIPAFSQTQEFTVGALVPLTGNWQSIGLGANAALELAHEHVEATLNPLGYSMNLVVRDTQSDPSQALEELKQLHAMGVKVVIGPSTSEEAAAIVDYANQNDILLISPSSSSEELTLEDNLFRIAPTDGIQSVILSVFLINEGMRNVLPIYIDDNYGNAFFDLMALMNLFLGINVHHEPLTFSPDTTNFTDIIQKAEAATAEMNYSYPDTCVFFIGNEEHLVDLIQQIPEGSPLRYLQWIANEAVVGSETLLQNEAVSDFLFLTSLTGCSLDTRDISKNLFVESVYQQLTDALGAKPSYYSLFSYDALWLASRLYDANVDAIDFSTLRDSFVHEAMHFYGLTGNMQFDDAGDRLAFSYSMMVADRWDGQSRWASIGHYTYNDGEIEIPNYDYFDEGYRPYGYNPLLFVPEERTVVTLGALLPLTGALASHGAMALDALQAGLQTIQRVFDSKGYNIQFELSVKDTQTDPDAALLEAKNLHDEGVEAIVGPLASACVSSIEEYVAENGLIVLSPMSTAPSLAKEDRILRMPPNDISQAAAIAAFLNKKEITSLLVLHRDDEYGNELSSILSESFPGDVLSVQAYPIQESDFSSYLQALEGALTESAAASAAVVVVGFDELASCIEQIPENSLLRDVRWIGTDGFVNNQRVVDDLQLASAAVDVGLTCSNVPGSNFIFFSVQSQILLQEMAALGDGEPLELAPTHVNAYDALWIAANLYQSVGVEYPLAEFWNYFEYRFFENWMGDIHGTYGSLVFDENGDKTDYYYDFNSVVLDEIDGYVWKRTAVYIDMDEISPEPILLDFTVTPGAPVEQWSLY